MEDNNRLVDFLNFEKEIRLAKNHAELFFVIANKSLSILPYSQAIVFEIQGEKFIVKSISATSNLNSTAPYIVWLQNDLIPYLHKVCGNKVRTMDKEESDPKIQMFWDEYLQSNLVYCPMTDFYEDVIGGVIYQNRIPYNANQISLVKELQLIYSQGNMVIKEVQESIFASFDVKKKRFKIKVAILLIFIFVMLLPVRQNILAPAEITPESPKVISPSLEGFIEDIFVKPNQKVKKGQLLFQLDQVSLENNVKKAENALKVAKEKYRQSFHYTYQKSVSENYISILKTEVEKSKNNLAFHQSLLKRSKISAPTNGTVIFSSIKEWIGKPVTIGEKVMLLAKDNKKELNIHVPVKDMLDLKRGDKLYFFSNISPLEPLQANVNYISTMAAIDNENNLVFTVVASFDKGITIPAFGSRGTAKLYSERVTLFYYLFRRPIIFLQSKIGM